MQYPACREGIMSLPTTNLWSSFLRESSKRSQSQESTCIIVGDESSGKRQLLNNICSTGEVDTQDSRRDIVSYKYFDVDDKDLESTTRVNAWVFDTSVFGSAYDILRNNCKSDKVFNRQQDFNLHCMCTVFITVCYCTLHYFHLIMLLVLSCSDS